MFRRLATCLLLMPLAFNGMRMVCVEGPTAPVVTTVAVADASAAPADASETCAESCPLMKQKHGTEAAAQASAKASPADATADSDAQRHTLCLLASNGDGACDAVFGFPVALPAAMVNFKTSPAKGDAVVAELVLYANPSHAISSPPPKA
jgi:hypothetical protein